jgi:hypothetical protein
MNEAPPDQRSAPRIDMHVHMVGNGVAGSGGWLRLKGWHRWLAGFMLRQLGVPATALEGDLETIYAEHLGKLVRESSMDAVVLLAHERVHDPDGTPREDLGSMFVPNDVVLGLAKRCPEFLPGVSIHPARPDALDELERCLEGGAVLMKCLPNCQNIDFSDRQYEAFWKRMAEARLPLLAHTGGEHTVPVINAALADPRLLRFPLECGVTVIAAHCATKSGAFDRDHFESWVAMLREFPNLYGDISAMVSLNPLRASARLRARRNSPAHFAWERFSRAGVRTSNVAARLDRPRHFLPLPEHSQFSRTRLAIQTRSRFSRGDRDAGGAFVTA